MAELTRRTAIAALTLASAASCTPVAAPAAPLAVDRSTWERVTRKYFSLRDAERNDPALRRAYDRHDRKWGKQSGYPVGLSDAETKAFDVSFEKVLAAEEAHLRDFYEPRWAAARAVYATPAPDHAAFNEKLEIAEGEGDEELLPEYFIAEIRHHLSSGRA